jgi:hypothetical protein
MVVIVYVRVTNRLAYASCEKRREKYLQVFNCQ